MARLKAGDTKVNDPLDVEAAGIEHDVDGLGIGMAALWGLDRVGPQIEHIFARIFTSRYACKIVLPIFILQECFKQVAFHRTQVRAANPQCQFVRSQQDLVEPSQDACLTS